MNIEPLEERIAPASIDVGSETVTSGDVNFGPGETFGVTLLDRDELDLPFSGQLQVTGSVTISGGALDVTIAGPQEAFTERFVVIENDGTDPVSGAFVGLPEGKYFRADARLLQISYAGGDGNDVELKAFVPRLKIAGDGKTASFTDIDGDAVTITTTRGAWTAEMFELLPEDRFIGGSALKTISIGPQAGFDGANISVSAKRDLFGGDGSVNIETIDAFGTALGKVTIAGTLGEVRAGVGGGVAIKKLSVQSLGALAALSDPNSSAPFTSTIAGDISKLLVSGDIDRARFEVSGAIKTVAVAGSFASSELLAGTQLGRVMIGGDLVGESVTDPAVISAFGQTAAPAGGQDLAIGSLTIGGRAKFAQVLAGYDLAGLPKNADASVGPVRVGTNWIASTLVAGTSAGADGFYGTADDTKISGSGVRDAAEIFSQIASITIGRQAFGTVATNDTFGIVAETIRKAKVGSTKLPFVQGPRTPGDTFYIGATGPGATGEISDFAIFEVQM